MELRAQVQIQARDRTGRFIRLLDDAGTRSMLEMKDLAERTAKELAPERTGYLRSTISAVMKGTRQFVLRADAPYAKPVEEGSMAHEIPDAFGRDEGVMHPGSGAQPFLKPTVQVLQAAAPGILRKHYP